MVLDRLSGLSNFIVYVYLQIVTLVRSVLGLDELEHIPLRALSLSGPSMVPRLFRGSLAI